MGHGRTEHDHDRRRHRCRVLPFVASRWLESPLGGVGVSLRSPSRPRRRSMLGNSLFTDDSRLVHVFADTRPSSV